MPASRVRVGIVAYNCADELARCLAALPAALDGLDADVVVVDNASTDDSAARAAAADVRLIRSSRNLGYARGMNRALAGGGDVLIALNPDTVPPPGSLAAAVARLQARPQVGLLAPLLVHPDGQIQHSVHRFPTLRLAAAANLVPARLLPAGLRDRLWLPGAVRPERTGPVDWAIGAVHVLRRAAVGDRPYATRWFMYVEDVELCARLQDTGWQVWFAGDVTVVHVGNVSGAAAFGRDRQARWLNETYDWYGGRRGGLSLRAYAALNALGCLRRAAVAVLGRRRGRPGAVLATTRHHLRVVARGRPAPAPAPAGSAGRVRRDGPEGG